MILLLIRLFQPVLASILFTSLCIDLRAQGVTFDWAVKTTGQYAYGAAVDPEGSLVTAFPKTRDIPGGWVVSLRLVKISASGQPLWSRTNSLPYNDLAIDSSGNIHVVGSTLRFPDGADFLQLAEIGTEGTGALCHAKMAPDGQIQIVRRFGPPDVYLTPRFCLDSTGNTYVLWTGRSDMPEGLQFTISKYDSSWQEVWSRTGSLSGYLGSGSKLSITTDGNLLIGGTVFESGGSPSLEFGGGTLTVEDYSMGFLLKLGPDGNLQWAVQPEGASRIEGLVSDAAGDAYIAYERDDLNPAVAKYNPAGEQLWSRQGKDLGIGFGAPMPRVAVDDDGDVCLAGTFWRSNIGKMQFGDRVLTTTARAEMFVVKYSSDGELLWATQSIGTGGNSGDRLSDTRLSALLAHPTGGFLVAGDFLGTVRFGTNTLSGPNASGPSETFIAHVFEPPPALPALQTARFGQDVILSWPASATGFQLQWADGLSTAPAWNPETAPVTIVDDRHTATVPLGTGPQFFRLQKP